MYAYVCVNMVIQLVFVKLKKKIGVDAGSMSS